MTSSIQYKFPPEYFQAQIEFAYKLAQIKRISIQDALLETSLVSELTNKEWDKGQKSNLWIKTVKDFSFELTPRKIAEKIYKLYISKPYSKYKEVEEEYKKNRHGNLSFIYKPESKKLRIHFIRGDRNLPNPLKDEFFEKRKIDFRNLLKQVKLRYPNAKTIKSSTWLHNFKNYRNLFPPNFKKKLTDIGMSSHLGVWGQFIRSDGSGNKERLLQFVKNMEKCTNEKELERTIPLKVFEAEGEIQEFYDYYKI